MCRALSLVYFTTNFRKAKLFSHAVAFELDTRVFCVFKRQDVEKNL